jgi:hypothetical protein
MDLLYRNLAVMHRESADQALCEEARMEHLTWAAHYDRWADRLTPCIDYSAITRDVVSMI